VSFDAKKIGVGWHLALHFPYFPAYDYDFVKCLIKATSFEEIKILTDVSGSGTLPIANGLDGLNIVRAKIFKILGIWLTPALIVEAIRLPKNSVIVYCASPRDLTTLIAALLARTLGKKVVFWGMFHSIGKTRWVTATIFKLMGIIGHKNFTYARTGAVAQMARGIQPRKLMRIGTAIGDISNLVPVSSESKVEIAVKISPDLIIHESTFVIAHVMRLSKFKNVEKFINCCVALAELDIDIKLIVVGGGEMDSHVKHRLGALGVSHVCYFAGPIYKQDVLKALYQISDVSLIATCIGLTLHQSLSYSVPVITDDSLSEQTSEFEILTHNYNGLIYRENDFDDLKKCVLEIYNDASVMIKLKQNAAESISGHSLSIKVRNFYNALNHLSKE
jgi:glycosyltransferase involved in cell wall biosynthesis